MSTFHAMIRPLAAAALVLVLAACLAGGPPADRDDDDDRPVQAPGDDRGDY